MKDYYKRGWGILVGCFSQEDYLKNKDLLPVSKKMEEYPKCKFVNLKEIKKDGKKHMLVYICCARDYKMRMW